MAKGGRKSKTKDPAAADTTPAAVEPSAGSGESSADAASSPVEAAAVIEVPTAPEAGPETAPDQPVEPRSDSFASVTPEKPNLGLMEIHEAIMRYVDDHRYREAWNHSIVKHASTLGYGPTATAEEWLAVFKSYGLKVKE